MYDIERNLIYGSMAGDELLWLYEKAAQATSVVEVGSLCGRSAHAILSACSGPVYCVDHFRGSIGEAGMAELLETLDSKQEFLKNVGHFPNMHLVEMDSVEAAKQFEDSSIDMIFLDGSHTYRAVKADFIAWLPKCKGLFCGHDFQQAHIVRVARELGLNAVMVNCGSIWILK